ncbi:MAG: hypothetical protein JJU42_12860 [Rhodobacteraceae bacterium]|nr:hypothetical protein [Paracoccaceae bacterium]
MVGRLSDWVKGFVMGRSADTLSLLQVVAGGVSNRFIALALAGIARAVRARVDEWKKGLR